MERNTDRQFRHIHCEATKTRNDPGPSLASQEQCHARVEAVPANHSTHPRVPGRGALGSGIDGAKWASLSLKMLWIGGFQQEGRPSCRRNDNAARPPPLMSTPPLNSVLSCSSTGSSKINTHATIALQSSFLSLRRCSRTPHEDGSLRIAHLQFAGKESYLQVAPQFDFRRPLRRALTLSSTRRSARTLCNMAHSAHTALGCIDACNPSAVCEPKARGSHLSSNLQQATIDNSLAKIPAMSDVFSTTDVVPFNQWRWKINPQHWRKCH